MQSVEEFIRQYFDERIVDEMRCQASRLPFRRKFHTDDCVWGSRAGTLDLLRSEKVLKISASDNTAEVITTRHSPGSSASIHRLRYHLHRVQDGWLIRSVDLECPLCGGKAKDDCFICQGAGWFDGRPAGTAVPGTRMRPPRRF